jgi:hypothetical protein
MNQSLKLRTIEISDQVTNGVGIDATQIPHLIVPLHLQNIVGVELQGQLARATLLQLLVLTRVM